MSRLAGLLLVVLTATSFAEETEPTPEAPKSAERVEAKADSKFPLRVVKLLPESEQALLFDKHRGRHVLVEVGESVGEYTVSAIGDDGVTLVGKDMPVEIALAAPHTRAQAIAKAPKPADPYAADEAAPEAPADPYADDEPRVVSATDGTEQAAEHAVEQTIRATQWNTSKADGAKSTVSPFATMREDAAKPSEEVANAGKVAPKPREDRTATEDIAPVVNAEPVATEDVAKPAPRTDGPTQLARKDVNAALTDFAKLATSIDGSFTAQGLAVEKLAPGSVFAKAGLLVGDVVTAVDGKPLTSIDDAADLYARAGGMKSATVQIVRAGKPAVLRIAIQ